MLAIILKSSLSQVIDLHRLAIGVIGNRTIGRSLGRLN